MSAVGSGMFPWGGGTTPFNNPLWSPRTEYTYNPRASMRSVSRAGGAMQPPHTASGPFDLGHSMSPRRSPGSTEHRPPSAMRQSGGRSAASPKKSPVQHVGWASQPIGQSRYSPPTRYDGSVDNVVFRTPQSRPSLVVKQPGSMDRIMSPRKAWREEPEHPASQVSSANHSRPVRRAAPDLPPAAASWDDYEDDRDIYPLVAPRSRKSSSSQWNGVRAGSRHQSFNEDKARQASGDIRHPPQAGIPEPRSGRLELPRRQTAQSAAPVDDGPAPPTRPLLPRSRTSHSGQRNGRSTSRIVVGRSMSHDQLSALSSMDEDDVVDMAPLRSALPKMLPERRDEVKRPGYLSPLSKEGYDRYVPHPADKSDVHPRPDSRSRGPESRVPAGSRPGSPAQREFRPIGYPEPTRDVPWNRDGPAMRTYGIPWHQDTKDLSAAPGGPREVVARPSTFGLVSALGQGGDSW